MRHSRLLTLFTFYLASLCLQPLHAQLGFDLNIKKTKPYEERELKAEKTGDKKFTAPRRIIQNTTTHYNYFFNASNKLNDIINRAKAAHRDNYAEILPFYNYSLENTAREKGQLDSVIYKSKTGIVLHDLRNDWIDDLYLLWGASYYLQQDFDSAYQMFQFINYAFAEKEKDGYYKYIGSRMDGNNSLSVSTKENMRFPKGLIADPPGRNDAFIWQIRTLIQSGAMPEAGSLIATLKNDPVFPKRLQPSLNEVQAYWFYQQGMWDSAATHLVLALDVADNKQEKARWEYLAAQLYEQSGNWETAEGLYAKSIAHTLDPVLDIYARLNLIRINKSGGDDYINKNIAELLKMAKRDRYVEYRDVIYYMAAQMELSRNNFDAAQALLLKSAQYKNAGTASTNSGFLQLADLFFKQKKYTRAAIFYDSVHIENLATADALRITQRKDLLRGLVTQLNTVLLQDSVQRIAAMPQKEREDYLRKLARQLRKQRGLKEDEAVITKGNTLTSAANPFGSSNNTKGEWYFYNDRSKTTGLATFKQVWGNRPNIDNWRRASNVTAQLRSTALGNTRGNPAGGIVPQEELLNYESLLNTLPLTVQQVQVSNDSIANALYTAGIIYADELEDVDASILSFEELRRRFGNYPKMDEALFRLYYGYTKKGELQKASEIKKLLAGQYSNSRYATIASTGNDPFTNAPTTEVTKVYEKVYDLYLEGNFSEANAAKKVADSIYHTNYWSPQLLYIQAVYNIKQRNDSIASTILTTLIQQNGGTPIGNKAANLLQVLGRRAQIETELTNLQLDMPASEKLAVPVTSKLPPVSDKKEPVVTKLPPPNVKRDTTSVGKKVDAISKDTAAVKPVVVIKKPATKPIDTLVKMPVVTKPASPYTFHAQTEYYAVVILNRVDAVFAGEARTAFFRYNREKFSDKPLDAILTTYDDANKLILIGNFASAQEAVDYVRKTMPLSPKEIVPWLKSDKYSFTILSKENLQAFIQEKNLGQYQKFLEQNIPVKF